VEKLVAPSKCTHNLIRKRVNLFYNFQNAIRLAAVFFQFENRATALCTQFWSQFPPVSCHSDQPPLFRTAKSDFSEKTAFSGDL
jgi:hypothetical protein